MSITFVEFITKVIQDSDLKDFAPVRFSSVESLGTLTENEKCFSIQTKKSKNFCLIVEKLKDSSYSGRLYASEKHKFVPKTLLAEGSLNEDYATDFLKDVFTDVPFKSFLEHSNIIDYLRTPLKSCKVLKNVPEDLREPYFEEAKALEIKGTSKDVVLHLLVTKEHGTQTDGKGSYKGTYYLGNLFVNGEDVGGFRWQITVLDDYIFNENFTEEMLKEDWKTVTSLFN